MTPEPVPGSRRRRRAWISPVWLVPLLCAAGLAWFVLREVTKYGPTITIAFVDGTGLSPRKSDLRYHGVKVGEVHHLDLSPDLRRVVASVRLERSASDLARKGSLFWIVRPTISAGGVRGLSAIISGAYIDVIPGHGEKQTTFEGLEETPAVEGRLRGLAVYVLSDQRSSFEPGAPVLYRGIKVGAVADSELAPDSAQVRARLIIERPYDRLVRSNSEFWNAGGVHFHLGIKGFDASAVSFATMVFGGLAFATPEQPGPPAREDSVFKLNDKPKDQWLKWRPKIELSAQPPQEVR